MKKTVTTAPEAPPLANPAQLERLHAVLETALAGIITVDSQGLVQTFNRAAEAIFGYSREELLG